MSVLSRIGVAIDSVLLEKFDKLIGRRGYTNRSEAFRDLIRDELVETLAGLPCPALGDAGACIIYESRPATCRMIGLPMTDEDGDVLENSCPIQGDFPEFAALAPVPFDLEQFESEAEACDDLAMDAGWGITTVAGAVPGAPSMAPQAPD